MAQLFRLKYNELGSDLIGLAIALLAYLVHQDENRHTEMLQCIAHSDHEEWIISRTVRCALMLGLERHLFESHVFLSFVRSSYRELWIGLLWDMSDDERAMNELRDVPLEKMTSKERRIWMSGQLRKHEHELVATLLKNWPDAMIQAGLHHQLGEYDLAEPIFSRLSLSNDPNDQRFGLEGLAKIDVIRKRASERK